MRLKLIKNSIVHFPFLTKIRMIAGCCKYTEQFHLITWLSVTLDSVLLPLFFPCCGCACVCMRERVATKFPNVRRTKRKYEFVLPLFFGVSIENGNEVFRRSLDCFRWWIYFCFLFFFSFLSQRQSHAHFFRFTQNESCCCTKITRFSFCSCSALCVFIYRNGLFCLFLAHTTLSLFTVKKKNCSEYSIIAFWQMTMCGPLGWCSGVAVRVERARICSSLHVCMCFSHAYSTVQVTGVTAVSALCHSFFSSVESAKFKEKSEKASHLPFAINRFVKFNSRASVDRYNSCHSFHILFLDFVCLNFFSIQNPI